jgi:hypothetical protein
MKVLIKKEIVAQCLKNLRQRRTHEHFAGYLCLQHRAAASGGIEKLQPNFAAFFDQFFRVSGRPDANPYVKPFINQEPSRDNLWLNRNVAGSYAPSSLRNTLKKVVTVSDGKYSLRSNHAQMAFEHLLLRNRVNAVDLAVVLYRDYPFVGSGLKIEDVVSVFASEFGYGATGGGRTTDFDTLYCVEVPETLNGEWNEIYE